MAVPILSSQAQLQQWADRLQQDVNAKVESVAAGALEWLTRAPQRVNPADYNIAAGAGTWVDIPGGSITVDETGLYEVEVQATFNLAASQWTYVSAKIGSAAISTLNGPRAWGIAAGAGCSGLVTKPQQLTAGDIVKLQAMRSAADTASVLGLQLILRPAI